MLLTEINMTLCIINEQGSVNHVRNWSLTTASLVKSPWRYSWMSGLWSVRQGTKNSLLHLPSGFLPLWWLRLACETRRQLLMTSKVVDARIKSPLRHQCHFPPSSWSPQLAPSPTVLDQLLEETEMFQTPSFFQSTSNIVKQANMLMKGILMTLSQCLLLLAAHEYASASALQLISLDVS